MKFDFPEKKMRHEPIEDRIGPTMPLLDRLCGRLRRGVIERFGHVLEHAKTIEGKSVLLTSADLDDYVPAMAEAGAASVLAIEPSYERFTALKSLIDDAGIQEKCRAMHGDPINLSLGMDRFDLVIAVGAFDHVLDPRALLGRLMALSKGRVMASFVRRSIWGSPWRKARQGVKGQDALIITKRELGLIACGLDPRGVRIVEFISGGMLLIIDV